MNYSQTKQLGIRNQSTIDNISSKNSFKVIEVMQNKIMKTFKNKLEKLTDIEVVKRILPHSKKVFNFFIKNKVDEVLFIIKKDNNDFNIEFKVLANFYDNEKYINTLSNNLLYERYEYINIISLKEFYLENMKYYVSDSGGSIS